MKIPCWFLALIVILLSWTVADLHAGLRKKTAPPAVSASGLAKAFEKDAETAKMKYAEGSFTLMGNVDAVKDKEIRLQTDSKLRIVLKAKKVLGGVEAGKEGRALTESARVKSFDGKVVVVECEEVVLSPRLKSPQGIKPLS